MSIDPSEEKSGCTFTCPECGAPIPEGGACGDNFHALLLLEAEVPGAAGSLIHFFTVATYNLQHPGSVGLTADAFLGLREVHARVLDGRLTVEKLRRVVAARVEKAGRVMQRAEDQAPTWYGGSWSMTCSAVLAGGATDYEVRVRCWAQSVRNTLDRALGVAIPPATRTRSGA